VPEHSLRPGILPSEEEWEVFQSEFPRLVDETPAVKFRLQILHLTTYDRAFVERVFYGQIN
jgi:hypothetical protein